MTRSMRPNAEYAYRAIVEYPWRAEPETFGLYQTHGAAQRAAKSAAGHRTDATARVQRAALVWEDAE